MSEHITPFSASICVFCGARPGNDPKFEADATAFGASLAVENWRLVYGAGDAGLMGAVARAATNVGAATFGVIPVHLLGQERRSAERRSIVVTENMHERKKVMFMNCDAIVVLPGGAGSLDELFEVLTWRQLGLHTKPIFLLNTCGYWDPLVALIDHMITAEFAADALRDSLTVVETVDQLRADLRTSLSATVE